MDTLYLLKNVSTQLKIHNKKNIFFPEITYLKIHFDNDHVQNVA